MADRSVSVTLRANVADFKAQMRQASSSLDELAKKGDKTGKASETAFGRMTQSMQLQREHWTQAGTTLTAFGVASAAALGASAKAAIDWESAFAGVLKTVDGSASELAALEEGLRAMALELPASHAEIAAVAEAAGQLGIETPNVLEFTRVMIDMGESTSMSAEEAATQLARFVNIMGTSQTEFSNIGSAVVELGNNFATTEGEIVAMSMRLAGAGAQLGLTEAEVLALATAMSSVGIEAEAGGTAMSQTMIQMRNAVDEGGASLEAFATAAGMSSEAFAALFRESPADAIQAVVTGLGEMEAQGINTSSVLSDMGATGLRQSDTLRRLSGDASILSEAFRMANSAYAENSALAEEAAQRYETVASQLEMARNAIVDAAISLGSVFMPAIAGAAGAVKDFAGWFASMPPLMQGILGGLGGVATVATLTAGGFLLLAPRVMDTVIAFQALKSANILGLAGGFSGLATSIAKFGAIGAGLAAITMLADSVTGINQMNVVAVEDLAGALEDLGASGRTSSDALSELFSSKHALPWNRVEIDDLSDAIDHLTPRFETLFGDGIGDKFDRTFDSGKIERIKEEINQLDAALAAMWESGAEDEATEMFGQLVQLMIESGASAEEATEAFQKFLEVSGTEPPASQWVPVLAGHLGDVLGVTEDVADASEEAAAAAEQLGISEEALTGIYDSQLRSLQDIIDARRGLAEGANSIVDAEAAHADAIEGLTAALEDESIALDKSTGRWDGYSTAGQQAHEASRTMTTAMWDMAESMHAQGASQDEIRDKLSGMRGDFIDFAMQMGATQEQAEALADSYGMFPDEITTSMELETDTALHDLNGFLVEIDESSGEVTINGQTVNAEESLAELLGLIADQEGMVEINGNRYPADMTLQEFLDAANDETGTPDIDADDAPARSILSMLMGDVDTAYDEVNMGGDDSSGRGVLNWLMRDVDVAYDEVGIGGDATAGRGVLLSFGNRISGTRREVTVGANTGPAISAFSGLLSFMRANASVTVAVGAGAKARAKGGYTPPGWTLVGEEGPELVNFTQPNRVYTAEETARAFSQVNTTNYVAASSPRPVVNVAAPTVSLPEEVVLVDESGGILTRARWVAREEFERGSTTTRRWS